MDVITLKTQRSKVSEVVVGRGLLDVLPRILEKQKLGGPGERKLEFTKVPFTDPLTYFIIYI